MILSTIKTDFALELILELPSDSLPVEFKVGKNNLLTLWYWHGEVKTLETFSFDFAKKGHIFAFPLQPLPMIWVNKAWHLPLWSVA